MIKLNLDDLALDSFRVSGDEPHVAAPADDTLNFMIAKCTGCPSGCGIIANEPAIY
ncbi:MAG: hypothetical protein JWM27_4067 [Gemmatimonadetes bacterium]|nr:hypothetical protein [Gemmatimonadota bacterium]